MPLIKPTSIVLQTGHGFLTDLVGAWLFTEGTNFSFADSSGNANHLSRSMGTGTLWTNATTSGVAPYLALTSSTILSRGAVDTDFNHIATDPWTVIFWLSRRGNSGGTYQRLQARSNNLIDMAFKINTWEPAWFSGAAWQDLGQGSAVSGADEMWAFAYDATNLRVFKGSAVIPSAVTTLDSRAAAPVISQTMTFFGNGAEDYLGNVYSVFYHRRALNLAQLTSHYSATYEAFQNPPAPASTPIPQEFWRGGLADGSYYHGATPRGGNPSLLDWLGGRG